MNIPKKIFINEHLRLFSNGQIRIPNKAIRIPQLTLQFWSFLSKFEEGDSNPSHSDSNPHSRKCKLTKAIRIPHIAIRIHILESANWRRRFESTFQKVQIDEGDSNPSHKDLNPHFREFRLTKAIQIQIPVSKLRLTNSNP